MLCFRTVPVVKIVMDKKGEHQKFPSIFFCLTVLNNSVGGILKCFSIFGYRKKLDKKVGKIIIFRRKTLSHCAKNSRRGTF